MTWAVETEGLTYCFGERPALEDISLQFPYGSVNVVVGANGAGKLTLLRVLAGKSLIRHGRLRIGGLDPFDFNGDRAPQPLYLGTEWASSAVVKGDMAVLTLLRLMGEAEYPERAARLVDILEVDRSWSTMSISDGQRMRVLLAIGLLRPHFSLLLLDEASLYLDIIARGNLLEFLKEEAETRDCCVVYATHIFDGMALSWCDRIIHLDKGRVADDINMADIEFGGDQVEEGTPLRVPRSESIHPLAMHWLRRDTSRK